MSLEKYGVVLDPETTKTASKTSNCPDCGRPLDKSTPNYCEDCGTKPFEKRPEKK